MRGIKTAGVSFVVVLNSGRFTGGRKRTQNFVLLLTMHLGIIFVNNQLEALLFFFMFVYFYSLHVSGSHVSIIRRIN